MKIWITKTALTDGILEVEAEISKQNPSMAFVKTSYYYSYYHGEGKEWHRTFENALGRAECMRIAKIKGLEKSLARIKALEFKKP